MSLENWPPVLLSEICPGQLTADARISLLWPALHLKNGQRWAEAVEELEKHLESRSLPPSLFLLLFLPLRAPPALTIWDAYRLVTCKTGELVAPACVRAGRALRLSALSNSLGGTALPPVTVVWPVLDKGPSGASRAGNLLELPVPGREGLRVCGEHVPPPAPCSCQGSRGRLQTPTQWLPAGPAIHATFMSDY